MLSNIKSTSGHTLTKNSLTQVSVQKTEAPLVTKAEAQVVRVLKCKPTFVNAQRILSINLELFKQLHKHYLIKILKLAKMKNSKLTN